MAKKTPKAPKTDEHDASMDFDLIGRLKSIQLVNVKPGDLVVMTLINTKPIYPSEAKALKAFLNSIAGGSIKLLILQDGDSISIARTE